MGERTVISAPAPIGTTKFSLTLHVTDDRSATLRLFADRREIAAGRIPKVSSHLSFWGLDVGRDAAIPVSDAYPAPFAYPETGLDRVVMRFFAEHEVNQHAAMIEATE